MGGWPCLWGCFCSHKSFCSLRLFQVRCDFSDFIEGPTISPRRLSLGQLLIHSFCHSWRWRNIPFTLGRKFFYEHFHFFFRQYQLFTHKAAFFFWRQSDGKPTENYILSLSCLAFQCDTLYLIYLNKDRYRRETNPCDERVELFAKTDPLNLLSLRA